MKIYNSIMATAVALLAAVSCTIESEDTFSTSPVAPVMDSHADILVTEGTKDEAVTFSWSAARFVEAETLAYDLHVVFGENDAVLAENVGNTYYTTTKTAFRDFLKSSFALEQNSTHSISVYTQVSDSQGNVYKSAALALKVYVYDEAVASDVTALEETIVLDKGTPSASIAMLTWTDARLVYGEDVTYEIVLRVPDAEPVREVTLATGLMANSWSTTVDALNESVVSAGGVEDAENTVEFVVVASCESIAAGVPSEPVTVKVTTYLATFPEALWLPGSHQGWAPASAPSLPVSKNRKGLYQGFVDLTTADGSDVEFKFSAAPAWAEVDFGFSDVQVRTIDATVGGEAVSFAVAAASTVASDNIKVPSGFYYIKIDKKFNTLEMVQVYNLEILGSFNNWTGGTEMTWDAKSRTWTSPEIDIEKDSEFKFRFNSDWTYSFGGSFDSVNFQDANLLFRNETGRYKIVFNVSSSDFTINAVDVNMPDYLVIAGDYSGHSWSPADDMRVYLKDSSKGLYKGVFTMYNGTYGFKFVKNGSEWMGGTSTGDLTYALSGGDNLMIDNGTYFWEVNILNMTAKAVPVTTVGIIGGFNNWSADAEMIFDEETLTYSIEQEFSANDEFKFRFNGTWDCNLGLSGEELVHEGGNIKVENAGTYVVTLDMAHGSYPTFTMTAR